MRISDWIQTWALPILTMRTPAALEAIAEIKKVDGAIVGAGTVVNTDQLRQVADAGIEFIVSPGLTDRLGKAVGETGIPFLPGVANAGDIMRGLDLGLTHFKFFPAETSGRSEEHTSELQSLMRNSYAVFCLKNKKT